MPVEYKRGVYVQENSYKLDEARMQSFMPKDVKLKLIIDGGSFKRLCEINQELLILAPAVVMLGHAPDFSSNGHGYFTRCDETVSTINSIFWLNAEYPGAKIIVFGSEEDKKKIMNGAGKGRVAEFYARGKVNGYVERDLADIILAHL